MLYFIPTPIGNIKDITLRWLELLKSLNILFCEDTRETKKLLQFYEIDYSNKKFFSITSFTSDSKLQFYVDLIKSYNVWVVSDAWTPWLSDPWKKFIEISDKYNFEYTILPGANALIPAVVWSKFDTSKFVFLWFLPKKKWRQTLFKYIFEYNKYPLFFYESVYRIEKTLLEFKSYWFKWKVSISREISKMYEEFITMDIDDIISFLKNKNLTLKGEFVVGLYFS